ncbi:MAG: exodeoxyribonuclease VII small subunit [Eubacterium sp.]|nr:exodeoxyribonuclease VII small subunit [Eubacterium sp.]
MELEEIMEKLEQTVEKMETEKMSLEESYQCFSQGMEYVKAGNEAIDKVEKKIQILMEEEDENE